jgi:hypothetical protein
MIGVVVVEEEEIFHSLREIESNLLERGDVGERRKGKK